MSDPFGNVVDIGHCGGNHDETHRIASSMHTCDDYLQRASSRFVENVNLFPMIDGYSLDSHLEKSLLRQPRIAVFGPIFAYGPPNSW